MTADRTTALAPAAATPADRFAQLDALIARVTAAHSAGEVAAVTAEQAAAMFGATAALVALLDDGGTALDLAGSVGYPAAFLERWRRIPLDAPLMVAGVVRARRPLVLPVLARDGSSPDAADLPPDAAGMAQRSFVAVPMLIGDRVHGSLALGFPQPGPLAADEEALLLAVGGQAALALERSRLFEAERASRERLTFLADASALLAGSLDEHETLDQLAHLVVPRLADCCVVHLRDDDGRLRQAALRHRDPEGLAAMRALLAALPVDLDMPYGAGAVVATGATQLFPTIPDEVLVTSARGDDALLAALRDLHVDTGLITPLTARGRTIGAMTLTREQGVPYRADQLAIAEDLGRRAGLAVDNARAHGEARRALAERDREAARAQLETERLSALLDQIPVGVILAEAPSGRVVKRNAAVDDIFRDPFEEFDNVAAYGRLDASRPDGTPLPAQDWPLARAVQRGETVRNERVDLRWSDGSRSTLEINAGPVRDPLGQVVAGVAAVTDVTSRSRDERELAAAARRNAELAHVLQANLLPPGLPEVPGLDLAAVYLPVGAGLEVGGDFYDVFPTGRDEEWAFAIGDVCGKGAEAAGVTSLARHTLQAGSVRARRPSVLLALLNETMLRQDTARPFITAVFGVLQAGEGRAGATVTLAVGGHPPPYVLRADGTVDAVGRPGSLVGVLDDAEFHDVGLRLAPGDALVLYTDGATEARSGDQLFGEGRLRATLEAAAGRSAQAIVTRLIESIRSFQSGTQRDDLALLVIRATL